MDGNENRIRQAGPLEPPQSIPILTVAELEADPHGTFRSWRPRLPVVGHEVAGFVVLRARDVDRLMRDPRVRATETLYPETRGIPEGRLFDIFAHGMLTANGATHRRRRSPFTRTFAARMIEGLRPRIRTAAASLIRDWLPDGEVDLVERYTALIPAQTLADILGLPHEDIPRFTHLAYEVSRVLSFTFGPEDIPDLEAAAAALQDYVRAILEARRSAPQDDFLSHFLAEAEAAGDLTPEEVVVQLVQMIIGGTDTTRVAGALQAGLLLQHREQWTAVRHDPGLIPAAVAEALRYEPSVGSAGRVAREEIDLDGTVVPAGSMIMLSTLSALRDEAVYTLPDTFDIRRADLPRLHPIFGGGAHRCIGEALARVELEEGLGALTHLAPGLRLTGAMPVVHGHSGIRRIGPLQVAA
ncbi:cytochrome P450 [Methylobacterium bullatum]|uniref:Cytochrome P450-pinF1, plant-inducible n=1 Tax=Methylobacterium bullatum TaxID=570505 RepID=A0AAV4ZA92_9HYPH|nr:cytochrome P450 [Methylobacterium bullatum]MBD8900696.1 cytochrome [Methylobacterium bullatum]GJD40796.1 Cytochrome P450-pinF1, plant-inducible [Methylobacterium bullatum]